MELTANQKRRFYSLIRRKGDCHIWQGDALNNVARFRVNRVDMTARQVSYWLTHGRRSKRNLKLICGERLCVNPAHFTYSSTVYICRKKLHASVANLPRGKKGNGKRSWSKLLRCAVNRGFALFHTLRAV